MIWNLRSTTYVVCRVLQHSQILKLKLDPNPVLTYSLDLVIDVTDFTLEISWLNIFGPKPIKHLSPYSTDLWCSTAI